MTVASTTTTASSSSTQVRTYAFRNEDHTLGNVLRYALMQHVDVEGAGYNIPHPSEEVMNVWVQSKNNVSPDDCMEQALENIQDMCDHVSATYADALRRFKEKNPKAPAFTAQPQVASVAETSGSSAKNMKTMKTEKPAKAK
ncbi:unnamed protein product [Amoebophrya sp. A120]|nr:unnamed protein product [Amoebophrya sp. A120]|eukprot:GSA120T00002018001.1